MDEGLVGAQAGDVLAAGCGINALVVDVPTNAVATAVTEPAPK